LILLMALLLVLLVVAATVLGLRREKMWKDRVAEEKRRGEDFLAEKQKVLDTAIAATFILVKEAQEVSPEMSYEEIKAKLPEGPQGIVDWFREKVGILNAATQHAQQRVAEAAAQVSAVQAENTLHRSLLEKALMLPLDTPPAHKELFLARCRSVLESQRATHDCPSEDFWKAYVERHRKISEQSGVLS